MNLLLNKVLNIVRIVTQIMAHPLLVYYYEAIRKRAVKTLHHKIFMV